MVLPTIFLNPLCKESNSYAGGGNEEYYMNLIIDEIIPYLKSSGIKYIRNGQPDASLSPEDLCIFIYSNSNPTSINKKLRGLSVCYIPGNPNSYRLAKIICRNIKELYPDKKKVIISPFAPNEVQLKSNSSVLLKIAYRDNLYDSNWIKENIEKIAENLAESICEYFSVPFITPIPMESKILDKEIKLYVHPNINSKNYTSIPSQTKINILGKWENWYIIDCLDKTGYIQIDFINK